MFNSNYTDHRLFLTEKQKNYSPEKLMMYIKSAETSILQYLKEASEHNKATVPIKSAPMQQAKNLETPLQRGVRESDKQMESTSTSKTKVTDKKFVLSRNLDQSNSPTTLVYALYSDKENKWLTPTGLICCDFLDDQYRKTVALEKMTWAEYKRRIKNEKKSEKIKMDSFVEIQEKFAEKYYESQAAVLPELQPSSLIQDKPLPTTPKEHLSL